MTSILSFIGCLLMLVVAFLIFYAVKFGYPIRRWIPEIIDDMKTYPQSFIYPFVLMAAIVAINVWLPSGF